MSTDEIGVYAIEVPDIAVSFHDRHQLGSVDWRGIEQGCIAQPVPSSLIDEFLRTPGGSHRRTRQDDR